MKAPMDLDSIGIIVALVLLLMGSAFFSAAETAFSSVNRIRLMTRAEDGDKKAAAALKLENDYHKLLSTVLVGNNIVNIAATALATGLFVKYWPKSGTAITTVVMTVVVLLFGEITPKTLAKTHAESVAIALTPVLRVIMVILTPLNALFSLWRRLLLHMSHGEEDDTITGEELMTMVSEAESEGGIDSDESELIRSAIEFGDLEVAEILIPRVDMTAAPDTATAQELAELFADSGYSRLPVYHETIDHITGILHEKDLRLCQARGEDWKKAVSRTIYTTPTAHVDDLLRSMQTGKQHMAIVVDEFGGTEGLVTLEDILEELVGEIWDEHDEVIETFRKQRDGSYLISCSADLDDMFRLFHLKDTVDSATIAGWVMDSLGHVPRVGDTFRYENLEVTVTAIRRMRVLEIRVSVVPEEEEEGSAARP